MDILTRVVSLAVRAYPAPFRARYAAELIDFIDTERQQPCNKGFLASGRFWMRTLVDLTRSAVRLRFRRQNKPTAMQPQLRTRGSQMDAIRQDLVFALRMMIRRPWFTAVIVGTLALGIGANGAIYSVVRSVVLQPLPYDEPESLVMVWEHNIGRDRPTNVVAPANFFVWSEGSTSFSALAALTETSTTITGGGDPERIGAVYTSASFFQMIGVTPTLGRIFVEADDQPGAPNTMVLTHDFWQRRFDADPSVLGRTVSINGGPVEIIGVLPAGFRFPLPYTFNATGRQDVWMPQQFSENARTFRGRWLQVVGRLQPGVSVEQANSQLSAMALDLEREYPDAQTGWTTNVVRLHQQIVGDVRTPLLILMGAVGFVLLIACANVANLLLSRATGREQEIAIRTALGAGRRRVIQQILTESLTLAVAGGAAGLLVSWIAVKGLIALSPTNLPRLDEVAVGSSVVLFTLLAAVLTGAVFGFLPAWKISKTRVGRVASATGARASADGTHARTRHTLVVVEFALSLMLLTGAGLLVKSFMRLQSAGVGFETSNLLTAQIQLPSSSYATTGERVQWFDDLVQRARAFPGVEQASAITWLPLAPGGSATSFWVNDRPIPAAGEFPVADIRWIHPDYHATMGIPLLAGRFFDDTDTPDGPTRVIVSQFLAKEFWPDENPIGKTISMPWNDTLVADVIGVVGDVRHGGPSQVPRSKLYWNHRQFQTNNGMTIVVKTSSDPTGFAGMMRAEVRAMDPDLPVYNVRTMDSYLSDSLAQARFAMIALGVFAAMALILACIGIFGVMSYSVSQRSKEIGIRMALGARSSSVTREIVLHGATLVAVAILLGLGGSLALSRVLEGMMFEVSPSDPSIFAIVSVGLGLVALSACYVPANRASKVDPVVTLKAD